MRHRPPCPKCKKVAMLARVAPVNPGTVTETNEYSNCDHSWSVEAADPIKSASGWLNGELRSPE